VRAETRDQLSLVAEAVAVSGVDVLVLGHGSDTLVLDGGVRGLVVCLGGELANVAPDSGSGIVKAGGGAAYPVLARRSVAAGLAGMEWAVGIPGSVGGAVRMNAGGHGASTAERLASCTVLDLASGAERVVTGDDPEFAYRRSGIGPHEIVTDVTFSCERGDSALLAAGIAEIVRWRRDHQPGGRNAGSVFTNPPGDTAGRLVEASGMKGRRLGTAEVSTKHANFIQVDAGGCAADVLALVELVRETVAERAGVVLETELRVVGEPRQATQLPGCGKSAR
jgi:UDP-N-acetylmuramate dehydrogenase